MTSEITRAYEIAAGIARDAIAEKLGADEADSIANTISMAAGFHPALSDTPAPVAASDARIDRIVTALYRRFKDWNRRGFGPDDVTWCEVRADVVALLSPAPAPVSGESNMQNLHNADTDPAP
jgi:hypothetical protein